jgi:hypothetical protein
MKLYGGICRFRETSLEEAFCNLFIVGKNARAYGF